MVLKTSVCRFSGLRIYPGRGILFVRTDSQQYLFINKKCKSLFNNKKRPAKLLWTTTWRKAHKKDQVRLAWRPGKHTAWGVPCRCCCRGVAAGQGRGDCRTTGGSCAAGARWLFRWHCSAPGVFVHTGSTGAATRWLSLPAACAPARVLTVAPAISVAVALPPASISQVTEVSRKKRRTAGKATARAIVGASLEVINKRRMEKPEVS